MQKETKILMKLENMITKMVGWNADCNKEDLKPGWNMDTWQYRKWDHIWRQTMNEMLDWNQPNRTEELKRLEKSLHIITEQTMNNMTNIIMCTNFEQSLLNLAHLTNHLPPCQYVHQGLGLLVTTSLDTKLRLHWSLSFVLALDQLVALFHYWVLWLCMIIS